MKKSDGLICLGVGAAKFRVVALVFLGCLQGVVGLFPAHVQDVLGILSFPEREKAKLVEVGNDFFFDRRFFGSVKEGEAKPAGALPAGALGLIGIVEAILNKGDAHETERESV